MLEAVILLVGWITLICWLLSWLWRWAIQVPRRRGSNPPAPGHAPPPPPSPPPRPQPTGGRLIRIDRDPGRPSLGASMDRDVASRLDELERRVAILERLTRSLSIAINNRHD
jgi:hypothetical protein